MKIVIIGVGLGNPDTMTLGAGRAVEGSGCLIGSRRMLDCFPAYRGPKHCAAAAREIADVLLAHPEYETAAVLMSGDVGFYSGARPLAALLERYGEGEFQVEFLPGVSSVQYFCARLGVPWDDAKLVSLHGREQDLAAAVRTHGKVFALTGGRAGAAEACRALCEGGLGGVRVWVGENLSYPDERITEGSAEELAGREFAPLAVLLARNPRPFEPPVTHGLPDGAFLRGDAPMTKQEVRAVSLAALALRRGDTVWDVGAGTGSVSVEAARVLPDGAVYAVEKEPAAARLLEQNRVRFGLTNLRVVVGRAPQALEGLPAPDAVFVGGSSGALPQTLALALGRNPAARVVVNAVTLETVGAALAAFNELGLLDVNVSQVTAARSRSVGGSHMMLGQNPVYILSGRGDPHG